jgi:hypothetical protein
VSFSAWTLLFALAALARQEDESPDRGRLQERAEEILRKNQASEITTGEARRRVQLLLKDLKTWSAARGDSLIRRTRTFSTPATGRGEVLTAHRCPLFFEEDLSRLCPLDMSRSEVWGATVVFCRYYCAPDSD